MLGSLMLGEGYLLVSPWKPVVFLIPIALWARIVSSIYDKHAARFHLENEKWNAFHLSIGLVAFLVALFMPLNGNAAFWAGLGAEIVILAISIAVYPMIANKDDRVPEEHHVKIDMSHLTEAREAKKAAKQAGQAELVMTTPDSMTIAVPDRESPEFAVRVAAEGVYLRGRIARAHEMVIRPTGKDATYGIVFTVDGIPKADSTLSAAEAVKIIDFWKKAAGLDVDDRRKKQVGMANVSHHEVSSKVRVATSGGQAGMVLTLTPDPAKAVRRKFKDLGFLEPQDKAVKEIVADGKGTVLIGVPADNGGTTLLYSLVKLHDSYTENVQTVELEAQDVLEGVRQNIFDPTKEDQEHATLVRSILRRDPDVVGVAELPDAATAQEIAKADHDRTRSYLLMRAPNAMQAIQTWCKAVGDLQQAGDALHGVVAGRLVRKLCQNCKVGYAPSADMLKKLGLPADRVKQLYKKGGQVLIKNKPETCPMCDGNGYFGQEGIFEVYPLGPTERELIKSGNLAALRAELRKRQLPTIQQAAMRKAVEGVTSIEEIMRVTASGASKKK